MIKRIKLRFLILATVSLLVLLGIIVAGMNLMNYRSVVCESDAVLSVLAGNGGSFPELSDTDNTPDGELSAHGSPGVDADGERPEPSGSDEENAPPDGIKPPQASTDTGKSHGVHLPPGMSPEIPFESRYFSVTLDSSGSIISTDVSRIASVSEEDAAGYVQQVRADRERGFVASFRYARSADADGERIVFLDCGRRLDSFRSFMYASIIMSAAGLAVVFVIMFILSGRIIRPIAESYAKQRQFITDAGHEIKTPLTVIAANVDLLASEIGENECLDDISEQTRRLRSLTDELVTLSRMEESERVGTRVEFPISELVTEAASPFRSVAARQGKELRLDIQPMLTLCGDGEEVRRLVGILLENALKYSPEGSTVSLGLARQGRQAVLTVENRSVLPIDRSQLDRVFDRFYRTDASRNSETGGHGIGLSIAKAIAVLHGGRIRASSEDGSSFRITASLPM